MIWIEKYRPKEFKDVVGLPKEIPDMLGNMPHFLFIGKPGTGKTTTAKIIIKKLGCDCLMLNASDERGIQVIRDKVKNFAMTQSSNQKIKIVFLDEFDFLTGEAQNSLRNMMETYHANTRFICTANYENKIIDALKSRFSMFRFETAQPEDVLNYLHQIVQAENINITDELLNLLIGNMKGDIRKCVNQLQRLSELKRAVTELDLGKDLNLPLQVHKLLLKQDFIKARQLLLDADVEYDAFLDQYHEFILDLYLVKKELSFKQFGNIIVALTNAVIHVNSVISKEIIVENFIVKVIEVLNVRA
jgi:replication factor C small subunit